MTGRIIKGVGGFYTAYDGCSSYVLKAKGAFRREKLTPFVGDFIEFTPGVGEEDGWIESIEPRKNYLDRPPVANIDLALLQIASVNPQPDLMMLDKLLVYCRLNKIDAAILISKCELDAEQADSIQRQYEKIGSPVIQVSVETGAGLNEVSNLTQGLTCAWAGQSGVGKSTLISRLFGLSLETGSLSEKTERGRHTTRHVELINVGEGTFVFDTPGFSLFDLPVMEPMTLLGGYPEFDGITDCKFKPCAHISEPDCEFKRRRGELMSEERYSRYRLLFEETRQRWRYRYG